MNECKVQFGWTIQTYASLEKPSDLQRSCATIRHSENVPKVGVVFLTPTVLAFVKACSKVYQLQVLFAILECMLHIVQLALWVMKMNV